MDWSLTHALNTLLARHDGLEDPLVAYASIAELLFAGVLVGLFVLAAGNARRAVRRAVVAASLSCAVALLAAQVVARLVDRSRPFVAHPTHVHLFAQHANDAGFPSDHATAAFAIATALLLRNRAWGLVLLGAAIVLGVARVGMAVHYPTDVIGGAALGGACAVLLWTEPVRARLDRLADDIGRTWDALLRAVAHSMSSARSS